MADIRLTGLDQLQRALQALGGRAREGAARALTIEAETIMTAAKRLTPVETGSLRASGHVMPPVVQGESVTVTLGFGGPAIQYAVPVHENLAARHPVGQAKFLETPMLAAAAGLEGRLAAHLQRDLERRA